MIVSVADRLSHVEEYYFSKKLEQIAQMRSRGINVINLGIGSPDLPPPSEAIETTVSALKNASNHGYSSYRSSPELRSGISKWLLENYQVKSNPQSEILPLIGSKE